MTCIVAWIEEDKRKGTRDVWMGGDTQGTDDSWGSRIRNDIKVFRKSSMLMGYTSSFRMGQILRFGLSVPEQSKRKSDYEYMCTDFIDAVADVLEKKKIC
jgi:hypothetical protein